MNQYIVLYIGGDQPESPEQGKAHFARYQAWLASLGDAVVQPMMPFKNTHRIEPDGTVNNGSAAGLSGYTLLQASSLEEALAMTRECPFLEINGTLEVAELVTPNLDNKT